MRSPIEHDPDMIAAIGVITVRWAALEHELVSILTACLGAEAPAHKMFFAVKNLTQRLDLVRASLPKINAADTAAVTVILKGVRDAWQKRNGLIHSHYVYHEGTAGGGSRTVYRTKPGANHPSAPPTFRATWGWVEGSSVGTKEEWEAAQEAGRKVISSGFGYFDYSKDQSGKFIPVNLGSFLNHAECVSGHIDKLQQVLKLVKR